MAEVLMNSFLILTVVLWCWAFIDILRSRFENSNLRILWIVGIIIFPVIGSIIYFQFSKKFKKEKRKFQPNFNKAEQVYK